jgi:hypothetical protein
VQGLRLLLGLALTLLVLLALVAPAVAQQQVTIQYVVLNLRSLLGTVPAGTTYEVYIPLPKRTWSSCSNFQLLTSTGTVIPVWVFECYDGDRGVPIHGVQARYTTTTPSTDWDTNPYFDDTSWVAVWGGAGLGFESSDRFIQAYWETSSFYAVRYIIDLPLRPSRAVLNVVASYSAYSASGYTVTINGCPGSNCLVKVNGHSVGSSASFTAPRVVSYTLDVTSQVQAGPNLITTTMSVSPSYYMPRLGVQLTAYYNGYWIARAYVRLPFDLTTTPTSVIVLPSEAANVKDPNAFLFFDDFDTWNPASYIVTGLSTSVSSGKLTITTTSDGSLRLAQTFNAPFAFIAKIDSNVRQALSNTFVYFGWPGAGTQFTIAIMARAEVPGYYTMPNYNVALIYGAAWPWLAGITMSSTATTLAFGQRYSATFTTISPLSTVSYSSISNPSSAVNPMLTLQASTPGYTVGIAIDWIAVFRPPADLRNPVYTAEVRTVTVSFAKIVLPGQPAANVLAYTFNATIYGGDMYNSGVLVGQGLMAANATTMLETYNVVSFPARSTLAIQLKYSGAFEANLAYVDPASGYTSILERLSYDGSAMTLTRGETLVLHVTPPASSGYVQLEIFGSERRVYVYTSSGTVSARGSSDLANVNTVLYRGAAPLNIIVMEGLLVTFMQSGLLAISIRGTDAMGRSIDIFVGDARSPTATGVDLDVAPETILIGVPLGVYPVRATVTAYLDAQAIQYSLIVPQIPLGTVTLTPGAPSTAPGGSLVAVLTKPLTALNTMVPAEHRPLVALTSVMILATLATLTTAPLFTVLAAVALLAFATAGWVSTPTALLAVLIVVGLALARRHTR